MSLSGTFWIKCKDKYSVATESPFGEISGWISWRQQLCDSIPSNCPPSSNLSLGNTGAALKKSFSENRLWSLDLAALTDPFGERTLNVERRTTSWIGWVGLTLLNIEENEKKTKSSFRLELMLSTCPNFDCTQDRPKMRTWPMQCLIKSSVLSGY